MILTAETRGAIAASNYCHKSTINLFIYDNWENDDDYWNLWLQYVDITVFALQIISVKTCGYRHKYHSTLLSIELLLQLQTIVTNVLRLPYFDDYLSKLAYTNLI